MAAKAQPLAHYRDRHGRFHELRVMQGRAGSRLVVDRPVGSRNRAGERLLAHLAADEPPENARIVCDRYLEQSRRRDPPRCRLLCPADHRRLPHHDGPGELRGGWEREHLCGRDGALYRLERVPGEYSTAQLRWCRRSGADPRLIVGLRSVVGACESYAPARSLTEAALAAHSDDPRLLVARLRWELERLLASPIVLNRRLRETVLDSMRTRGESLSDIARRCGAVKRNRRGRYTGETSWLSRRIGLMPESGAARPTPWIHIDVLASIARDGLAVSPREVEL